MRILAIETSCDETAAAVVEDGRHVLSSVVSSQIDLHARFGGVVPEVASRAHLELLGPVVDAALGEAGVTGSDLDAVAATIGPGLIGSLLVGVSAAKAYAMAWGVPFVGVNHMEAHLHAALLEDPQLALPAVVLLVSGGHTMLIAMEAAGAAPMDGEAAGAAPVDGEAAGAAPVDGEAAGAAPVDGEAAGAAPMDGEAVGPASDPVPVSTTTGTRPSLVYRLLGQTIDDAAGEAFDKVARYLGLGYPGGPAIDRIAEVGDPAAVAFPRGLWDEGYDFSFSGLKTSVITYVRKHPNTPVADVAASFQEAVVDVLATKARRAAAALGSKAICIGGGVAANSSLRRRIVEVCTADGLTAFLPSRAMCTDNAAMIGATAWYRLLADGPTPLDVGADPNLRLRLV